MELERCHCKTFVILPQEAIDTMSYLDCSHDLMAEFDIIRLDMDCQVGQYNPPNSESDWT